MNEQETVSVERVKTSCLRTRSSTTWRSFSRYLETPQG